MNKVRFIAGSGRSGTTWVLDSLAKANGLRPVFEPLNPYASDIGYMYAHRALLPSDDRPELRSFLLDVIDGRRERLWTQFRRQRKWLTPNRSNLESVVNISRYCRRLGRFVAEAPELAYMSMRREPIVKCIWGNLLLNWIAEQLGCLVVLIVRHPGAVIESELRSGWDAEGTLERFRRDPQFHDATNGRYLRQLERPLSSVEALALRWLIENQTHIENASSRQIVVAFYEDLVAPEQTAWAPICGHLELADRPNATTLARPSQQSWTRVTREAVEASNGTWRDKLSQEQSAQIQGILDDAEFDCYAMTALEPSHVTRGRSTVVSEFER